MPIKLINLIRDIHSGVKARVRASGSFSDPFDLLRGLKQGSVFAPLLFNIFFSAIIHAINKRLDYSDGIEIKYNIGADIFNNPQLDAANKISLSELLFADDAALMASSEEGLQRKMDIVVEVVSAFGQLVSIKKTEVMVVQPRVRNGVAPLPSPVITIDDKALDVVSVFKYVGSKQNDGADISSEIITCIQKMAAAYNKYRIILFENRRIKLRARLEGFVTFVLNAGLYCCETWNSSVEDIKKLEAAQFMYLKRILKYKWYDYKSFADVIHECRCSGVNMLPIGALVSQKRLTYLGHVNRMEDNRYPKIILYGECCLGKRRVGGQELSFKSVIKKDLYEFGIGSEHDSWYYLSLQRLDWRAAVKTSGVVYFMQNWYRSRAQESNERHLKLDPCYSVKVPYVFNHVAASPGVVCLNQAVLSGAVTVGRGRHERTMQDKLRNILVRATEKGTRGFVRDLLSRN